MFGYLFIVLSVILTIAAIGPSRMVEKEGGQWTVDFPMTENDTLLSGYELDYPQVTAYLPSLLKKRP